MSSLGRRMFAGAFIAFGVQQFLYGDFVAGRAPAWPSGVSGQWLWAYASGACFILAGAAIAADRQVRHAAWLIAALVFAWALVRNIPLAIADGNFGSPWTRLGKGIALCGGAAAVAGSVGGRWGRGRPSADALQFGGRIALGVFLVASGIQHFLFPAAVKTLVPAWIPGALIWTYIAGTALAAGGVGLIVPTTRRLAGACVGLMLSLWVCILHVPRALAASPANQRNEWIAVVEAFAFAGIAFLLTRDEPRKGPAPFSSTD